MNTSVESLLAAAARWWISEHEANQLREDYSTSGNPFLSLAEHAFLEANGIGDTDDHHLHLEDLENAE
jgi:hypothetical protein